MTDTMLLMVRLLMASCFLPTGIMRLSNISGFAVSLSQKGFPFTDLLSAFCVLAEVFGPLALLLGVAPRLTASVLIGVTLIVTGSLHGYWNFTGAMRQAEQAAFFANFGVLAGLLLYLVTGPGAIGWRSLWMGAAPRKAPPKKKSSRPRAPRPKPDPFQEELADAA
jgi:putative oxidoreductase